MAKQKKKKKRRGFRLFVKIQLVLIVLVLAGLAFYLFGGYAKKISDLKSDAYDKVHSATDETFRSSQTSLVYDTNGNLISVLKGEKDMYYLEYEEIPSDVCSAIISIEDKNLLPMIDEVCKRTETEVEEFDAIDRKSTRLNSSHVALSRMPSSA